MTDKKRGAGRGAPEMIRDDHKVAPPSGNVKGQGYHVNFRMKVAVEFSDPQRLMAKVQANDDFFAGYDSPEGIATHVAWWFAPEGDVVAGARTTWTLEGFELFELDDVSRRWVSESEEYGRITVYVVDDLDPLPRVDPFDPELEDAI